MIVINNERLSENILQFRAEAEDAKSKLDFESAFLFLDMAEELETKLELE